MNEQLGSQKTITRTNSQWKLLEWIPLILISAMLILQFSFIVMKSFDKKLKKQLRSYDAAPLIGMQINVPRSKPKWSLASLMAGTWQKEFETWFNFRLPFRAWLVRSHNQIYYNLFSKSYMYNGNIIIGQHHYLYELPYLIKYCNSNHTQFYQSEFNQWATELKTLSNFFAKRGQQLIYFITPSKVSYFPEYLPKDYKCHPDKISEHSMMITALNNAHIRYVDAAGIVKKEKNKYGYALFPQGGTHWSNLAAALAASSLVDAISDATKLPLPKLRFSSTIHHHPKETDADLISLTNLLYPKLDYPVPKISVLKSSKKSNKRLNIVMVGGSFADQAMLILNDSKIFNHIDIYKYLILSHLRFTEKSKFKSLAFENNSLDSYKDLFSADVIILEENEQNFRSNHTRGLTQLALNKKLPV